MFKVNKNMVNIREMEHISKGSTIGDFVTILTEMPMQDNTVAKTTEQEYKLPLPPLLNVMFNIMNCVSVSLRTVTIFHAHH
jgi:hypothetical protein